MRQTVIAQDGLITLATNHPGEPMPPLLTRVNHGPGEHRQRALNHDAVGA